MTLKTKRPKCRGCSDFSSPICYSRMMYIEFTLCQGIEQFTSCHRHALEFFGGSPARVSTDYLARHIIGYGRGSISACSSVGLNWTSFKLVVERCPQFN
jgi:hypothetical protein